MAEDGQYTTTLTMPSSREIIITRVFAAPPPVVFRAWTQPEHVKHWYGTPDLRLIVCEIDLRPGGRYRYVLRDAAGQDYSFTGVYREVTPPGRLVYTDGFEGLPRHEALVTLTFEEDSGKTRMVSRSLYQSEADRNAHIGAGMEQGMRAALERFAAHLQTIAAKLTESLR